MLKNQLLGITAAIGAASLISLFTARRIEAQYSSPVKVVNSTAAPVINSGMDNPGRSAYQTFANNLLCGGSDVCPINFPAVPAGHRLVISQISISFQTAVGNSLSVVLQGSPGGGSFFVDWWFPPVQPTGFGLGTFPVTAYVESGQTFSITGVLPAGQGFSAQNGQGGGAAWVTGYLLDCTAAPCSPVAH